MRLWSLHPKHLDAAGLVALWREGLLAKAVLRGRTKGYRHHPQLERFRETPRPVAAINTYLAHVHAEATRRGYEFDARKLAGPRSGRRMLVTNGQVRHEWEHLLRKLSRRSPEMYRLSRRSKPKAHPSFRVVRGTRAEWERV